MLGKGLAELFGENNIANINDLGEKTSRIIYLELSQLTPSPYQPRKSFDERYLQDLALSIKEKGVLQPILAKEIAHDQYEIIAGERRWRASKMAGLGDIPAIVLDITTESAMEIALIENIQREQLSPIEEAGAIDRLIKNHGYTHEKLSSKIGRSRSHITNMLRLLLLPEEVQELLDNNKISMGHARALLKEENSVEMAHYIAENNLSVRDTEAYVKQAKKEELNNKKIIEQYSREKKEYLKQIEERLKESLKLKTKISHNGERGNISIYFNTIDELELIISNLGNA